MREEVYEYNGKAYTLVVRREENALRGLIDGKQVAEISGEIVGDMRAEGMTKGSDISNILMGLLKDEIAK